jgi:hypothetical protein
MRKLVCVFTLLAGVALPGAASAAPSDPLYPSQQPMGLIRHAQAIDMLVRAPVDISVFIPETGLDLDHPDLGPRLFRLAADVAAPKPSWDQNPAQTVKAGANGWDMLGNDVAQPDPVVLTPDGNPNHPPGSAGIGTLVAGVLGGAHNGVGSAGVAPNARFIALRSCWESDNCFQSIQAPAINWAAARGARVVVFHTLFGPAGSFEQEFRNAITNHPNVLFVAIPSGNGGATDADPNPDYPCGLQVANVLCVTASSPTHGLDCSAFGRQTVDLAVPTRNNFTTVNGGTFASTSTQCFVSYASPIAGGLATLLFGLDPSASPAHVKAAIMDGARRVPAWSGRSVTGGVLDAANAVTLFQSRRGLVRPAQTQLPPPVLGRSVNVTPRRGQVYVSLPRGARLTATTSQYRSPIRGRRFQPLREARQIPVGSFVDVRRGSVRLVSARDTRGRTQAGEFAAGVFQVLQSRRRSQRGATEMRLRGGNFNVCRHRRRARRSSFGEVVAELARHRSRRKIRGLRARTRGNFRKRGRGSVGTSRGTDWSTTDRCDGTLTRVTRGRVDVRDLGRRRTIRLRARRSYLARVR